MRAGGLLATRRLGAGLAIRAGLRVFRAGALARLGAGLAAFLAGRRAALLAGRGFLVDVERFFMASDTLKRTGSPVGEKNRTRLIALGLGGVNETAFVYPG